MHMYNVYKLIAILKMLKVTNLIYRCSSICCVKIRRNWKYSYVTEIKDLELGFQWCSKLCCCLLHRQRETNKHFYKLKLPYILSEVLSSVPSIFGFSLFEKWEIDAVFMCIR